jgi:flagellar assembly protein FliH
MTSRLPHAVQDAAAPGPVIRNASIGGRARVVGRALAQAPAGAAEAAATDPVAAALSRLGGGVVQAAAPAVAPAADAPDHAAQLRAAREQAFEEGRLAGLEEQRHAMFEQGLREGLAEGRAAGELESQRRLALLHEQATERLRRVDEIGAALAGQWSAQLALRLASAEDDMVALCHSVICRFLGDSLVNRDGVARLMRAAIEQWLQAGEKQLRDAAVVVRVHPADLDAMKADEALARWLVQQGVRGVHWQATDDVALGGCVIQGTDGDLDARLETQLRNLQDQLLRGRERNPA